MSQTNLEEAKRSEEESIAAYEEIEESSITLSDADFNELSIFLNEENDYSDDEAF